MVVNTHELRAITVCVTQEPLFSWKAEASDVNKSLKGEHLFDVVLTGRDVGQQVYIPNEHVNKLLFILNEFPVGDDLLFVDSNGGTWWFTFSGYHKCFSGGWAQFVWEKHLAVADMVSFWRSGIRDQYGKDVLFVDYEKKKPGTFGTPKSCQNSLISQIVLSTIGIPYQLKAAKLEDLSSSAGEIEEPVFEKVLTPSNVAKIEELDTPKKDPGARDSCSPPTGLSSVSRIHQELNLAKLELGSMCAGNVGDKGDMRVVEGRKKEVKFDDMLSLGYVVKTEKDPKIHDKYVWDSHSSLTSSSSTWFTQGHLPKPRFMWGENIEKRRGDTEVVYGKNPNVSDNSVIVDSHSSLTSSSGVHHQLSPTRLTGQFTLLRSFEKYPSDLEVGQGRGEESTYDSDNIGKIEKNPRISQPSIRGSLPPPTSLSLPRLKRRKIKDRDFFGVNQGKERKLMFEKVLDPSDVGKLNRFVIPWQDAEKHFPLSSFGDGKYILFRQNKKLWRFRYSYLSIEKSYVLTGRWSQFVKKNKLASGSVVSFFCGVGKNGKDKLYIDCHGGADHAIASPPLDTDVEMIGSNAFLCYSFFPPDYGFERDASPHVIASSPLDIDMQMICSDALFYCTLFPPDYGFEGDTLVLLWVAEGFFAEEVFAEKFFKRCCSANYFQFLRKNLVNEKDIYKFTGHSQLEAVIESRGIHIARMDGLSNLYDSSPEVSRVSLTCNSSVDSAALVGFKRFKELKTLMVLAVPELGFKHVPRDFLLSMKQLRVLDLSRTHIQELPSSIGNMKSLRYLDLSENPITRLPETTDCLTNLQTLRLRNCSNLSTLPKGTRKLVNLRHLDLDVIHQLRSMPQGIGALSHIQTLSGFLVGMEDGYGIEQLKSMNYIKGSFCISRLENVLAQEEAIEACLSHKSQLQKLELHWTDSCDEDDVDDAEVLSSLRPNTNLEELQIVSYNGVELPKWLSDPSFASLVNITLFKCKSCLVLPSLGQLPSLRFLSIVEFHKVKVIDHGLYEGVGIFPKLEKLIIDDTDTLEEWKGTGESTFPCLRELTLKNCPKLHRLCTLSFLSCLEVLELYHCGMLVFSPEDNFSKYLHTFIIEDCPLISAIFSKDGSEDLLKLAHVENVWIDHKQVPWLRISSVAPFKNVEGFVTVLEGEDSSDTSNNAGEVVNLDCLRSNGGGEDVELRLRLAVPSAPIGSSSNPHILQ